MPKATRDAPLAELEEVLVDKDRARESREYERALAKEKYEVARLKQRLKIVEDDNDALRAGDEILACLGKRAPTVYEPRRMRPSGPATAVLPLTDWHCEELVNKQSINGVNEYNLSIADTRIKTVAERAVALIECERGLSKISDMVLPLMGDFISGHIHPDLIESTALSPTEAIDWVIDRIDGVIRFMLKHSGCKTITIPTCNGNHGRDTEKRRVASAGKHSYEWLMYRVLERLYKNEPRVQFKIEQHAPHNILDIQGKLVRFQHGDLIRYQGGVYGLGVPVEKARAKWNDTYRVDYDFFGHWHTYLTGERWCACNCLIGYNLFAQSIKAAATPPTQTLAIFDRKRPLPVLVRQVFCDKVAA